VGSQLAGIRYGSKEVWDPTQKVRGRRSPHPELLASGKIPRRQGPRRVGATRRSFGVVVADDAVAAADGIVAGIVVLAAVADTVAVEKGIVAVEVGIVEAPEWVHHCTGLKGLVSV
jgi:hypothetical protein